MTFNGTIYVVITADNLEEAVRIQSELSSDLESDNAIVSAWGGDVEENDDE